MSTKMSETSDTEVVLAFMTYSETRPMGNDFKEYWSELWKPITQQCLNVTKNKFVLQKAFELFKTNRICHESTSKWSDIFIHKEEEDILKSLCRHVGLQEEEFLDFGFNHHEVRCQKYHTKSRKTINIKTINIT